MNITLPTPPGTPTWSEIRNQKQKSKSWSTTLCWRLDVSWNHTWISEKQPPYCWWHWALFYINVWLLENRQEVIKTFNLSPQYIFQFMIWNNWQHLSFECLNYYYIHFKNKKWKAEFATGRRKSITQLYQQKASQVLSHRTTSNVVISVNSKIHTNDELSDRRKGKNGMSYAKNL